MACLIDAWRHIHLPSLHCIREIKKIRPSSYQNSLLQGMNNIDFLFMGDTHIRHNIVFFCLCAQLVCREAGFAPVTPLPPDGFVLVRWEGGLCSDFCTAVFPAAGRVGRAIWSFDFLLENFRRPVSLQDVNMRAFM